VANNGVVYVATGERFINEAEKSARSVKLRYPDLKISIFSDREPSSDIFDNTIIIENPNYSIRDKVENLKHTPYEKTVFLDTDTFVCSSSGLKQIFDLLDEFDFAASYGLGRTLNISYPMENTPSWNVPDSFPWFNTGVIGFKSNPDVIEVIEEWSRQYDEYDLDFQAFDQAALREPLFQSNVRIATLPFEYNYHVLHPQAVGGEVHIIHGHLSNLEYISKKLNGGGAGKRFFIPIRTGNKAVLFDVSYFAYGSTPISRAFDVIKSVKERGAITTIKSIYRWKKGGKFN
jgi:hypothetical protein